MRNLLKRVKPNASFEDCLTWMCTATEYDGIHLDSRIRGINRGADVDDLFRITG